MACKDSEMNITGTLPQAGNLKLFVPSLSTQGSTRPKQNIFVASLMACNFHIAQICPELYCIVLSCPVLSCPTCIYDFITDN